MEPNLGFDAYSPREIAERVNAVCLAKSATPLLSLAMLGMLAGGFIGLGSLFYVIVVSDPTLGFAASRVAGGAVFSLGLLLLWVQPPLSYLQTVLPPHDDVIEQWNTKEGGRATRAAVVLFRREGIPTQVHLSVGDAALEVRSLAEETAAELVALGTRGLGAAHHALVGSVALKSAAASPVPVLLVP